MKKILYFFVGCLVVGAILSLTFSLFPALPLASTGFLITISKGQYEEAYQLTSSQFQQQYPLNYFQNYVNSLGLNQYYSVEWKTVYQDKNKQHGTVTGNMTTKTGRKIPIRIEFIMESENDSWFAERQWSINRIETPLRREQANDDEAPGV